MSWPERKIESWEDFESIVEQLIPTESLRCINGRDYLFRGQSDVEWDLKPSFYRNFKEARSEHQEVGVAWAPEDDVKRIDEQTIWWFKERAHDYLSPNVYLSLPKNDPKDAELQRLHSMHMYSIMQQHGAPTPLLDWTQSPFVALYFAVENNWTRDGAVWLFSWSSFATWGFHHNENDTPFMEVFEPMHKVLRLSVQQAVFTYSTTRNHAEFIEDEYARRKFAERGHGRKVSHLKLIIPARSKSRIMRKLRLMNMHAESLFPGIDGLGRKIAEECRLRADEMGIHPTQPERLR